jgi:WD40 repeat protein
MDSCVAVLENHVSVIRGLDFTSDGGTLVSGSRDQVVNFWDMKSYKLKTTLPIYEVRWLRLRSDYSLWKRWDIFPVMTHPTHN